MITYPTGPKVPRAWAFAVTDAANAVRQAGVVGGLMREGGPLGSGVEPLPANNRDRRGAAAAPDLGCYRLVAATRTVDGETVPCTVFGNQYHTVGDNLFATAIETAVEDLLPVADAAEADSGTGAMPLYVALCLDATGGAVPASGGGAPALPAIEAFPSLAALQAAQLDPARHVVALYLLDVWRTEDGDTGETAWAWAKRCDFRRGVHAQQVEILP